MKNALNYYYGLDVSNIHQKNQTYYFEYQGYQYILEVCDIENINNIYECSLELNQRGFFSHQIILNNSNGIVTAINNINYVLMKVFVSKKQIDVTDIIIFNNAYYINSKIKIPNWYLLWTGKVDYFEYQMNQMGKKYKTIRESFNYYIGLAENAISLIKTANTNENDYCLSHTRVYYNSTLEDLYNPLHFVIDLKYRDICEYFKDSFFNNNDIKNSLIIYMDYNVLNYNDGCIFLSRMLFPTYYFDVYEKIINDEIDESNLNHIIIRAGEYEQLLKMIYKYLKSKFGIPSLEWLTN